MNCQNCGNNLEIDNKFCGKCGSNISDQLSLNNEPNRNPNTVSFKGVCEACGKNAATKYIVFYENKGAVLMRYYRNIKGNLCKECIDKYFWKFTLTTLFVGWIGTTSLLIAPIYIVNNIFIYVGALIKK